MLLLNQFIFHNYIFQDILYHNEFTVTLQKSRMCLRASLKAQKNQPSLNPEFSSEIFKFIFSWWQLTWALDLTNTDSSMCHFSPKQSTLDHCTTVCPVLFPAPLLSTPPPFPYSFLAGVHVTSPDLLPVLAAGQLGRLKPLLYCHEPFLNTSTAQLGTFCPTRPRPHFTPYRQKSKKK